MWDFWLARDGADHHVFYLQAPRSLGDPERRHWHTSIGHAVSTDLRSWEVLPDALAPGPDGAWDDYTTWTGSVVRTPQRWAMLYTGTSRRDDGLVQRIGLAWSDDLVRWNKDPSNPVLSTDERWYERLDLRVWHDEAWRDPCVVRDHDGEYHLFVTARANTGDPTTRGVIGHATSSDLLHWRVHPPVLGPTRYGYLEIPQVVAHGGAWHLLFSVDAERLGDAAGIGQPGTFHAVAEELGGPYVERGPLLTAPLNRYYGAKVVVADGGLQCLAWLHDRDGVFDGALSDPWPVTVEADGRWAVTPIAGD